MSYRTFKRLLGETSLERKCRLLFGLATLCLITVSFVWYGWSTEGLATDQAEITGRLAVSQAIIQSHLKLAPEQRELFEKLPESFIKYESRVETEIVPRTTTDPAKRDRLFEFEQAVKPKLAKDDPDDSEFVEGKYVYRLLLQAGDSCMSCHRTATPVVQQKGDTMGMAVVRIAAKEFTDRVHVNLAILISTALISALLLMAGSWLIVRYVIVKPVKHLKDVSDAIAAGNLNIRSEILTGDEFEDLSHAYNRMLRSLMDKEDELRRVNTDLNKTVDDLAQANLALHTASQLKGDFLATMSHELRTPLSTIIGFSELLQSGATLTDKQRKWAVNIFSSGKHLLNLLNDVLELAKIEAGKMQVRVEEFNFLDLCEGVTAIFAPQAEHKNLHLTCNVGPTIPPLRQDAQKLRQILWNLLSNAVKFTPEDGSITVTALLDDNELIVHVADTGIGIEPEDQESVFEKFRQSHQVLTREQGGSGLGLSISRELAKLLGGDITLRSEVGKGTTFTVRLPVQLDDAPGSLGGLGAEAVGEEATELAGSAGRP